MCGVILDMTFNFSDAFLQMLSMCDWNVKLLSKNTPKSYSQELLLILFVFYHDACFYARATNKMKLI